MIATAPGVFVVGNEADLRGAIEAANAADQVPLIELETNIVLTSPLPDIDNPGKHPLVIKGNNHVLDANDVGRVLSILDNTTVTIEDLTITGGNAGEGCGGGVFTSGKLTLRRSKVIDNVAKRGGGICVIPGETPAVLTLEQALVSENEALYFGGGIFALGLRTQPADALDVAVSVSESRLEANRGGQGGGLFADSGINARVRLDVIDSTVIANHADSAGGGLLSRSHEGFIGTNILRTTIADNTGAFGAGFHNQGAVGRCWYCGGRAVATIINSTLSGNSSSDAGGAIANYNYLPPWSFGAGEAARPLSPDDPPPIGGPYISLSYCTITDNIAGEGSGILNRGDGGYVELWGVSEGPIRALATVITDNLGDGAECSGRFESSGYNLDGDGSCRLTMDTDRPNGNADLMPLALNAPGTTMTHALGPDSEARNRIPPGQLGCGVGDTDQRGVARSQPPSSLCDIGSYEADD